MKKIKGQLVCQHLENISRTALEKHQDIIKEFVKGRHGVYALYSKDKLYYVGLASNLRNRLKIHLKDRHANTWDKFSVYLTYEDHHLKELETLMIKVASPRGNKISGNFLNSANLKPLFKKRITKSHQKELELIFGDGKKRKDKPKLKREAKLFIFEPALAPYVKQKFPIRYTYKGTIYKAMVRKDGTISLQGNVYNSPSIAGYAICGHGINGWLVWKYKNKRGVWVPLDTLRKRKTK